MASMHAVIRRKFAIAFMAVLLVLPPLSGIVMHAFGLDDSHAHFDHVWHQTSLSDHQKQDHAAAPNADIAGDHANTHVDHVHMTVMTVPPGYMLEARDLGGSYAAVIDLNRSGRDFSPPGRPPQLS